MEYFKYLLEFNFSSFTKTSFIIRLLVIVVIMKIIEFLIILISKGTDKEKFRVFNNLIGFTVIGFFMITNQDYNRNYDHEMFRFSTYTKPINNKITIKWDNPKLNEEHTNIESQSPISNSEDNSSGFNWNDIKITDDINQEVDESKIIQSLGLTNDHLIKVKKILSDPNPDPKNIVGDNCGQSTKKCKWCGKEISSNVLITTQKNINDLTNPYVLTTWGSFQIGVGQEPDIDQYLSEVKTSILAGINNYNNTKYTCFPNLENYCSEKCKYDSKK